MTQPREVWSAQLRILAGRAVEEAPQVGFAEKVDRRGRVVRISILAEVASAGAGAFMDQFVRRIGELFDPTARSLTGAIKVAVETTHEELRVWNRQHLPSEQAMYGVSILIQRGEELLILGQAGPSVGLLAGVAGLAGLRPTSLYVHRSRLDDPVSSPIGGSDPVNLEFAPGPEASDGWALLLTSNAAGLFDPQRRVTLSRLAVDEVLRHLYPSMLNLRDAAGLIVSLASAAPPPSSEAEAEPEDGVDDGDERAERSSDADDSLAQSAQPDPADQARDEGDAGGLTAEQRFDSGEAGLSDGDEPLEQSQPPARQWDVVFAPTAATELEVVGWPVNPFVVGRVDQAQMIAPPVASHSPRLSNPIMKLGRAIPSLLETRREPAVERPNIRTRGSGARAVAARRAGLILIAMLVVLASVVAVLLGPSLLQSDDDQFRSRVERARNGLAASQLAVTTEAARLAVEDALSEVELALEINPLAAEALQLREEIEAVLAELNLIQSPGGLAVVADLSRFGPSIALGAIGFGAGRAFVIDDAGGRVFSVTGDGAVAVIFLEGELLGLGDQSRAGRPISIAWQSAQTGNGSSAGTSEDALWILDSHARLYRWTPSGVLLVPIPELVRLGSVDAVAATAANVYLLDQAGGAVWRFALERSELSEPVRALGRVDLLDASELVASVNAAGAVEFLIASSDGRVRRFGVNEELPLALGLEQELLSPASLSLGAQSGLVYVVDRGEGRLLAVGPSGEVVSQIQSAELAELRGAWVDEQSGQIIYALPASILTGRLPARQE